jgi:trk system potassium uptake protein TrkH
VTHAFRRTIPETTIQRAIGLVVMVVAFISAAILVLQFTELGGVPHHENAGAFLELTFEAVSAYNTVGLSLGITPFLTWGGKLIIAILMYVGRIGPLTFAASMMVAARRTRPRIRYSTEDVIIG